MTSPLVYRPTCKEEHVDPSVSRPDPQVLLARMECISDSIARCQVAESAAADASSKDVGSPASVKKIPGEYLSVGCDSLSDL